jgi:DNA-binding MarR family transcriptional regulator
MGNGRGGSSAAEQETEITLGVLDAVQANASVTQRSVAQELGIALGLANAYLKRCIKKGLIKVQQMPPNRYAYYLTPQGITEKSRLTAEYLTSSFTFFRRARAQMEELLAGCAARGWRRVALIGASELAEIAALCNAEHTLDLVVVEPKTDRVRYAGLEVVARLADAGRVDAAIVTSYAKGQAAYEATRRDMAEERILTPRVLRVRRIAPSARETEPEAR